MSRYLSGRLGSSALASPAQSRATTPEKPQAQAPVLETPSRAALAPAAMGSDSSPPRVSTTHRSHHMHLTCKMCRPIAWHRAITGRLPGVCGCTTGRNV